MQYYHKRGGAHASKGDGKRRGAQARGAHLDDAGGHPTFTSTMKMYDRGGLLPNE